MEHFKNFITMFFCVVAGLAGIAALCIALFQYKNYPQAILMVLPLVAAYPTLVKWFKGAYNREHGK